MVVLDMDGIDVLFSSSLSSPAVPIKECKVTVGVVYYILVEVELSPGMTIVPRPCRVHMHNSHPIHPNRL